jgi:dTDP-4-dehydrorhamnose reductase
MTTAAPDVALELWGGVECTVNRVGDRCFDQMVWSGHDARSDDLARIAALGIRTLRYPVLWERLAPERPDQIDWRWSDERLAGLRALGIRPIVGLLHHGSGPSYTSLLDPGFPEKLATFARAVAQRYPWIADFTPVNEPLTTARFSALYGHWFPHLHSDRDYVRALLQQLRGVVLAMRAIREVTPGARLVQTEDCGRTFGTPSTRRQVAHERHRRWLTWDLLMGRVGRTHPLRPFLVGAGMTDEDEQFFREADCSPGLLGLNYYLTSDRYLDDRLDRYPPEMHGGNGEMAYADTEAVRTRAEGIAGHEAHLLAAWHRYRLPVAITEVHLGCTREEQIRWLLESWRGAHAARARGADVRAVTAWALLGSFNWDSLVTRDAGRYEPGAFDVRAPEPRPTAVAHVVRTLASGDLPAHAVCAGAPWWHRSDRLLYGPMRGHGSRPSGSQPILIIGSTGTLGRAFQRVCDLRGLCSRLVGRTDVDITDPTRVDAVLRSVEPWAVVNAAGYVRVDDAERDAEACRRANVIGPINLAAGCRRHDLPLVTFSSDLVFDGRTARPYTEDDEPRPLNVYGATKAEAERRVLELLPGALVIRTSAFFGPWDPHNFLAQLFRTLDAGRPCQAVADCTVSPTYVPDLVHASLDLLIDGERGLWHLANEAALTWFEFAQAAARRSGRTADLVLPVGSAEMWSPAVRPHYSALATNRGRLLPSLDHALSAFLLESVEVQQATGTDGCVSP